MKLKQKRKKLKQRRKKLKQMTRFHLWKRSKKIQSIYKLEASKTNLKPLILTARKNKITKSRMWTPTPLNSAPVKKLSRTK